MASFNFSPTNPGTLLMADVQNGAVLVPTKFVIGTGFMSSGQQPANITSVITPLKEFPVSKKSRTPEGSCIFGFVMSNEDITDAFYLREIALYAKAEYRDGNGNVISTVPEVCLTYGNSGDTADYYPAYSTSTIVERALEISCYIGASAQVDLTIESGIYALKTEIINDNLLHNWYFGNPVNRKGQTTYGHVPAVAIDRWNINSDYGYVDVVDGFITIRGNDINGYGGIEQMLPPGTAEALNGKTITVSILAKTYVDVKLGNSPFSADSSKFKIYTITRTITPSSYFLFNAAAPASPGGKIADIIAAKYEVGDQQTLAHLDGNGNWVLNAVPDFSEEYAKCVQYSLTDGSYIGFSPASIGAAPTIDIGLYRGDINNLPLNSVALIDTSTINNPAQGHAWIETWGSDGNTKLQRITTYNTRSVAIRQYINNQWGDWLWDVNRFAQVDVSITMLGNIASAEDFLGKAYNRSCVFRTTDSNWNGALPASYAVYTRIKSHYTGSYDMWLCTDISGSMWYLCLADNALPTSASQWHELGKASTLVPASVG